MIDQRYIDEDELEGRTVEKAITTGYSVFLRFTDGTFTQIKWVSGYYEDEGDIQFSSDVEDWKLKELYKS